MNHFKEDFIHRQTVAKKQPNGPAMEHFSKGDEQPYRPQLKKVCTHSFNKKPSQTEKVTESTSTVVHLLLQCSMGRHSVGATIACSFARMRPLIVTDSE